MQKITCILILVLLGASSCRPSYMRCPKNRRCKTMPNINKTQQLLKVNNIENHIASYQF